MKKTVISHAAFGCAIQISDPTKPQTVPE